MTIRNKSENSFRLSSFYDVIILNLKLLSILETLEQQKMEYFEITNKNGIRLVKFNNVRKKNALNKKAYIALGEILNAAAIDDSIKCLVLTGKGDFFR